MKSILKFLLVPALLFVALSVAYADTVTIGSYGTGQDPSGANNSALAYLAYNSTAPITAGTGSGITYNLSNVSPWADAISGSSWVSEAQYTTVNGGVVLPNGYYTYTSTFSATPGLYTGTIYTYADDTLELFINGNPIVPFAGNPPNGPCAQGGGGPTCTGTPWPTSFSGDLLANNTITVVDWQSNASAAGVDFEGALATPEPSILLLFGTGLGAVGLMRRKLMIY